MVTAALPSGLQDWREAPRVRAMNDRVPVPNGRYVLCWLQQALRARDNPVIDASVRLGNALNLPVLVYHGVREDYPYASDRLHRFILGASVDLTGGCRERGLACVRHIDRAERQAKGLVYRLAAEAAAVVLEDQPTFVARWQAERVATRAQVPVFAANAACLVPPALIGDGVRGRSGFLRRHEPERAAWSEWEDEKPDVAPYAGELPFTPDRLEELDLDALVATLPAAAGPASSRTAPPRFTLDTPIAEIAADPQGRAVLEKDIPGLLAHPAFASFKDHSLNGVAPHSGGALTEAMLKTAAADLLALGC